MHSSMHGGLCFSVERLRKHKEADRRRREAEIPEQRCARLERQKAYCQKRKAESTQSECISNKDCHNTKKKDCSDYRIIKEQLMLATVPVMSIYCLPHCQMSKHPRSTTSHPHILTLPQVLLYHIPNVCLTPIWCMHIIYQWFLKNLRLLLRKFNRFNVILMYMHSSISTT